jgi:DNA invertase Pin-like site-specific DNA recombinase
MKVFYSRVSTSDGSQKHDRQLTDVKGFDYVFSDSCSGSIDLFDRPKGSQLKRLIDQGKLTHLEIHSIDRIGRNALSILDNYNYLTQQGVRIVCRNPQLSNFNDEGKADPFSDLLLNLFASIAQYERSLIVSRIREGIEARKSKNLYTGRAVGTSETTEKFLKKSKSKKIIELLEKGYSYSEISSIVPCSTGTIVKVNKLNASLKTFD